MIKQIAIYLALAVVSNTLYAQTDSLIKLAERTTGYVKEINKKANLYSNRISTKTIKSLQKLTHWENKIKKIVQTTNPDAYNKLFAPGTLTFSDVLLKVQSGQSISKDYISEYNGYIDQINTSVKYLHEVSDSNAIMKLATTSKHLKMLEADIGTTEQVKEFIKERKDKLVKSSIQNLQNNKYVRKITKESFYYVETLKNYKELFQDEKKVEKLAKEVLNKIPAFKDFSRKNSMLASLFPVAGITVSNDPVTPLAGLQTRASVNALIQDKIKGGGADAMEIFSKQMQLAQDELTKLKAKLPNSNDTELPDFKPNMQKTKTFLQRIDYGFDLQFSKNNSYLPGGANIGLNIGYKLNDKSIIGFGGSYKLGMGSIDRINFSHQGLSIRTFIDWKLKKQWYVSGGFEMNHSTALKKIPLLKDYVAWRRSTLIGISKKISINKSGMKSAKFQLLYDLLYKEHFPHSQPFIYRIGYSLK